jgi:hypothetical protein
MYAQNILPCIKIPNLQTRRRHQLTLKLMYTIKHKMLPNYLIDIFTAQVKYMITVQDKANSISRYLSLILILKKTLLPIQGVSKKTEQI